jgi:hypothetical protein
MVGLREMAGWRPGARLDRAPPAAADLLHDAHPGPTRLGCEAREARELRLRDAVLVREAAGARGEERERHAGAEV